jgi:hypothetical protein
MSVRSLGCWLRRPSRRGGHSGKACAASLDCVEGLVFDGRVVIVTGAGSGPGHVIERLRGAPASLRSGYHRVAAER